MEVATNNALSGRNLITNIYIQRVLGQSAKDIIEAQNRVLSSANPKEKKNIIASRRYVVSGTQLNFTHSKQQRFIDMRRVAGRKRKSIPLHNKVIYKEFSNIIAQIKFGLTEDVQYLIANEYNLHM
ncbi:hypothetical protein [Winogradskyella sp.]|uniref:hypothetical protein n=1 Tax=Winogradskyella sp. TaxID=1883156 RepID=UPI003BAB8C8D